MKAKKNLLVLVMACLLFSCGKNDTPETPATEKLLRTVVYDDNRTSFEYNTDKTVRKISNSNFRLEVAYANRQVSQLRYLGTTADMSVLYTYDANNKISSFKHGSEPVTAVQYNAQTNTYYWTRNNKAYSAKLTAMGDIETYIEKEPGEDPNTYVFAYDNDKNGPFANSTSIILQSYMLYDQIGIIFTYLAGITNRPVDYFSTNGEGMFYTNQYDKQGFVVRYGIGDDGSGFEY